MNQQYILNKVLSKRNTYETRLCIDWLITMLWPEALRDSILFFPGAVAPHSLIQCSQQLYSAHLPWVTRMNWNSLVFFHGHHLSPTVFSSFLWYHPGDLLKASRVENIVWYITAQWVMYPHKQTKNTPVDYFILKMYKRMTSKLWNSLFLLVYPQIWNWFSAHQGGPVCSLSPLGFV